MTAAGSCDNCDFDFLLIGCAEKTHRRGFYRRGAWVMEQGGGVTSCAVNCELSPWCFHTIIVGFGHLWSWAWE